MFDVRDFWEFRQFLSSFLGNKLEFGKFEVRLSLSEMLIAHVATPQTSNKFDDFTCLSSEFLGWFQHYIVISTCHVTDSVIENE